MKRTGPVAEAYTHHSNELLQFAKARNFLTSQENIDWWRHSGLNSCVYGVCESVGGWLVSLVVGSSVTKTWKWISLWNCVHQLCYNGRMRRLPWQPVQSDCKGTTSILFNVDCGYAAEPACCALFTDREMIPASNATDKHTLHFRGELRIATTHPDSIGTVHSPITYYPECFMFSVCM